MAEIPRKTQKIFGSALVAEGNVEQFGSLVAGAPVFSKDPAVIQALTAYLNGWSAGVVGNRSPVLEELNGLFLLLTQQLAYIFQSGVPEWDPDTEYFIGNLARIPGTSIICASLSNSNIGNDPATDTNNWTSSATSAPAAAQLSGGGPQTVAIDGLSHKILFVAPYIDAAGNYDAANAKYVAPSDGNYLVTANVQADNSGGSAANMEMTLQIVVNSTLQIASGNSVPNPPGGRWFPRLASMIALTAGDEVEIHLTATDTVNSGNLIVANSDWSIHRL